MRLLFIGDVVGSPGRELLETTLPQIRTEYKPQLIIANGENAAGGRGINEKITKQFFQLGINVITMGNHIWDQGEILDFIDDYKNLLRPANLAEEVPGNSYTIINYNDAKIGVVNLMGRTFMPPVECPFKAIDRLLEIIKQETDTIIIDFHAEATSEKIAMSWHLAGRVTALLGTHTHVQTADERILPGGTAYISDVGMVGPYDGILGMAREEVIQKFITQLPQRFEVEKQGATQFNAVLIDIDLETGRATTIKRIRYIND
jgi:metallophosphoesterase (TIGR00282 family)